MKRVFLCLWALSLTACATVGRHTSSASEQLTTPGLVSGVYRGVLKNRSSGVAMGAMEIDLTAVQVPGPGGFGIFAREVLAGKLKISTGDQEITAAITEGGFVSEDGTNAIGAVDATITVNLGSGSSVTFLLVGTLNDGSFSGTITPTAGITGAVGSFDLTKDASMPQLHLPSLNGSKTYVGTYENTNCQLPQFKNSSFCRGTDPRHTLVTMTVDMTAASAGYAFVNLFADVKICHVQLKFDEVELLMPTAELNPHLGMLHFNGVTEGDTANSTLTCRERDTGYRCSFQNSAYGTTYNFDLKPQ